MTEVIEVFPSKSGDGYGFHKKSANGEITSGSGSETYEHPYDAKVAAIKEYGEDLPVRVFYRNKGYATAQEDDGGD